MTSDTSFAWSGSDVAGHQGTGFGEGLPLESIESSQVQRIPSRTDTSVLYGPVSPVNS